jgi:hypothetical protein
VFPLGGFHFVTFISGQLKPKMDETVEDQYQYM